MRLRTVLAALLLALAAVSPARAQTPRLVRVDLSRGYPAERLFEHGLDVVEYRPGRFAEILEWPGDDQRLAAIGAPVRVTDADPGRTAAARARADEAQGTRQPGRFAVHAAPPHGSGGLAGFFTLAEVKLKLDDFVANDVHDVVADQVDTVGYSIQGRPVWGLRLGKHVTGPDTRPVVFYNSLTHAREPGGMQALLWFVDDLIARYDTDPIARALLDNRVIYICPVVNPDGYFRNQNTWQTTGSFGLWRKNVRDNNGDGSVGSGDGVDINRNYGDHWGFNNLGSSGTPSSETYRGPSAFSEIETRIQRDLVASLQPTVGLSFHTYSDLLVHPWGWTTAGTPDSLKFQEWSDELSLENGYSAGPGPRILYEVNGEFNDWCYGDTLLKPRAFTWTPEVGSPSDGFWPPASRIVPLNEEMLPACYALAKFGGAWLRSERVDIVEGALNAGHGAHLAIRLRNIGARGVDGGPVTATLSPISPELQVLSGPITYPALASLTSADADLGGTFFVTAADTTTPGRLLRLRLDLAGDGGFFSRDTIEVIVGTPTVMLLDGATNLINWNVGGGAWGIAANDFRHPSRYFSDSPLGRYQGSLANPMTLKVPLNLSAGVHAWLLLENRWTFESDYDTGVLEASRNGSTWTPLASQATTRGSSLGPLSGQHVFDGTRWLWHPDRVDLSAFAGGAANDSILLRWRVIADSGTELDGLSIDSLRVLLYDPAMQPPPAVDVTPRGVPARLALSAPQPNPTRGAVAFTASLPCGSHARLVLADVQGRHVRTLVAGPLAAGRHALQWNLRDDAGRDASPGVYFLRLEVDGEATTRRLIRLP